MSRLAPKNLRARRWVHAYAIDVLTFVVAEKVRPSYLYGLHRCSREQIVLSRVRRSRVMGVPQ